jgi:hypothetical protein
MKNNQLTAAWGAVNHSELPNMSIRQYPIVSILRPANVSMANNPEDNKIIVQTIKIFSSNRFQWSMGGGEEQCKNKITQKTCCVHSGIVKKIHKIFTIITTATLAITLYFSPDYTLWPVHSFVHSFIHSCALIYIYIYTIAGEELKIIFAIHSHYKWHLMGHENSVDIYI